MICFLKFRFTTVNPTSPLRNSLGVSLFQLDPLSWVSFNHFSDSTILILSTKGARSRPHRLAAAHHNVGIQPMTPSCLGGNPPRVINVNFESFDKSRVLKLWLLTCCSNCSSHNAHQSHTCSISQPNPKICNLDGLTHKQCWGELAGQENASKSSRKVREPTAHARGG